MDLSARIRIFDHLGWMKMMKAQVVVVEQQQIAIESVTRRKEKQCLTSLQ